MRSRSRNRSFVTLEVSRRRFGFRWLLHRRYIEGRGDLELPLCAASQMEKQGVASYWVGNGRTQEDLNRLTEYSISDGGLGDFVPAPFCHALGIDDYDPDNFGGKCFPKQISKLSLLFRGGPVPQSLLEAWPEIPPSNCAVTLFDYAYDGLIPRFEIDEFTFVFLGAYSYS